MSDPLRFGILGTGNIAGQFARDVKDAQKSQVVAVASRSTDSAHAFGETHSLHKEHCHGSYDELLQDAAVDAVYISLPNHLHREWSIKALEAGKHVLCEKPCAMNLAETQEMFSTAERCGKILMEGFMYRCHPLMDAVLGAVRSGAIGELRFIRASFCYHMRDPGDNVRFQRQLGGGALMDIGCYCLNFARLFAGGEPEAFQAVGRIHQSGVDDLGSASLRFGPADSDKSIVASLTYGMSSHLDNTAHLGGTDGFLEVPIPWKPPQQNAVYLMGGQQTPKMAQRKGEKNVAPEREVFSVDAPGPLFACEADAFADAVAGRGELPISREDTFGNMRLLDALRQQIGVSW